jgi:hypothetical protein
MSFLSPILNKVHSFGQMSRNFCQASVGNLSEKTLMHVLKLGRGGFFEQRILIGSLLFS